MVSEPVVLRVGNTRPLGVFLQEERMHQNEKEGDAMKFGIIHDFRNPRQWRRPWPALYGGILDRIVRAEELGYDNVWLAEHHFAEDGYNPAPLTTAAAIARQPRRSERSVSRSSLAASGPRRAATGRGGVRHAREKRECYPVFSPSPPHRILSKSCQAIALIALST